MDCGSNQKYFDRAEMDEERSYEILMLAEMGEGRHH